MGDLIALDGTRLTTAESVSLEVPDIAAAWHQISTTVAMENGVVKSDSVCHFLDLHPVMASLMCESFDRMIKLGIIIPGAESALIDMGAVLPETSEDASE